MARRSATHDTHTRDKRRASPSRVIHLAVPVETANELEALADGSEISLPEMVRRALQKGLPLMRPRRPRTS